jgi:uncharacterized protein YjlB
MPTVITRAAPITYTFVDDGNTPNNSLPLILYRGAVDLAGSPDPELIIEKSFATNGWGGMWRNDVYAYTHYHAMIHEVMGIARGQVKVLFGGDDGDAIDLATGDVVILPAGTGHRRLAQSSELVVIGAYPPGGKYNLSRGSKAEHAKALTFIPKVPPPSTDLVFGAEGPLTTLWRA